MIQKKYKACNEVYLRIHEMYLIVLIHEIKRCDHIWRIIWHHHWYKTRLLNFLLTPELYGNSLPVLVVAVAAAVDAVD